MMGKPTRKDFEKMLNKSSKGFGTRMKIIHPNKFEEDYQDYIKRCEELKQNVKHARKTLSQKHMSSSILIQKLSRHESNSGQVCSVCFHAVSNHKVSINTKKTSQMAKLHSCEICGCRKCKW